MGLLPIPARKWGMPRHVTVDEYVQILAETWENNRQGLSCGG